MYNLITDPQYKIPQLAPDGNYCPIGLGIEKKMNDASFDIFPNPATNSITVSTKEASGVAIFDITGKLIRNYSKNEGELKIDITSFREGVYIVRVGVTAKKLIINR